MALRIPPVILVLIAAFLMWGVATLFPALGFDMLWAVAFSVELAIVGLAVSTLGVVAFRQVRTTVNPRAPELASVLVVAGIYRYTRNPMYLGFLILLVGWAVFLENAAAFLVLPLFVLYMNRFQIQPEEKALETLFGQEFVAYKQTVRRWI